MRSGTLLKDMAFTSPITALFFNHNPNKLLVACKDNIFVVDVCTQVTQPFSCTSQGAYYYPHALALSDDDAVLLAGNAYSPFSVYGYDTASLARLWIHKTDSRVGAVCMFGAHVLVVAHRKPTLFLDYKTGTQIAALQKADGSIYGLGVVEGLCLILS